MLDPAPRAPARIGRRRRAAGLALAACAVLYLAALAVLSSAPVARRLHERVHAVLRARLGDVRLEEEVEIDPLFRLTFGALEIPGPSGGPPLVRAEHVAARPSLTALLRGRFEPATVLLGDVRVRPGPDGRDLRAFLERVRRPRAPGASAGDGAGGDLPKLKLRGIVVIVPLRGEQVEVGPIDADVRVTRGGEGPRLDARVSLRGAGHFTVEAARVAGTWRASLHAEDLGPAAIPAPLRSHAAAVTGGALTLDVDVEAPAELSRATATVRTELDGLVLAGERIAEEPVGPLHARASGRLVWDGAARRVTLSGEATFLRAVTITGSGEVHLEPPASFSAAFRAERIDWAAVLSALPAALALPPQAPRPAGVVSGRLELSGPLHAPEEWTVAAALDLAPLRDAARRAGRSPLAEPFVHRPPLDEGGRGPELRVGPASPGFVPVAELPEHVVRAVTTAEDAGFFGHAGFDFDELKNAIAQGARRGRLVRGGSTISQQVAKNLFLDGERTFARKVREAAVTVGLEATLPKRRIVEIYLNVAEWGPGLWGIGPAARHWFAKDARALTPKEAALLASVIPSPVRYHEQLFARGGLDDVWEARVDDLLFTMNMQGALSDAQLAEAMAERITFASAATAAAGMEGPAPAAPEAAPVPAAR